jgi:hypothetical protein
MNRLRIIASVFLMAFAFLHNGFAQQPQVTNLGDNAALRYWSAFAQMQDTELNPEQVKILNSVVDGKAPYDDAQFRELISKNIPALQTMARGTKIPNCVWGLDYALGPDTPIEYVRKALTLGRLNVLHSYRLLKTGDKAGAVQAISAGLRFSADVAKDGTLLAALASKALLVAHLNAARFAAESAGLSNSQIGTLRQSIMLLGNQGIDWAGAINRELDILRTINAQFENSLSQIRQQYIEALRTPSTLRDLQQTVSRAPQTLSDLIPSPDRVVAQKQELDARIQESRASLNSR